jgi:hypothetical protein
MELKITREWVEKRAALEADLEIGAGSSSIHWNSADAPPPMEVDIADPLPSTGALAE